MFCGFGVVPCLRFCIYVFLRFCNLCISVFLGSGVFARARFLEFRFCDFVMPRFRASVFLRLCFCAFVFFVESIVGLTPLPKCVTFPVRCACTFSCAVSCVLVYLHLASCVLCGLCLVFGECFAPISVNSEC